MNFEKLNNWLQVSANIGIVLGLVLVGFQLKQNSELARIQLLYEESNRAIELETEVVGERAAEVWAKSIQAPEDLTLAEIRIMEALLWSFLEQLRGTYRLAELGLLSNEDWRRRAESEVTFYFGDPYSRAWWKNFSAASNGLPEELHQVVDDIVAGDDPTVEAYITRPQRTLVQETKALSEFATDYAEAWSSQDPGKLASFYSENGVLQVNDAEPSVGRDAITQTVKSFMSAFPDMVVRLVELRRDAGQVQFHWHWTGTNTGPGGTGNSVDLYGYEQWSMDDDGLILKSIGHYDEAAYQRQMNARGED
ncbi:MAG: nuclear transport factor 2 family protein [Woeseiaceae bacterium]